MERRKKRESKLHVLVTCPSSAFSVFDVGFPSERNKQTASRNKKPEKETLNNFHFLFWLLVRCSLVCLIVGCGWWFVYLFCFVCQPQSIWLVCEMLTAQFPKKETKQTKKQKTKFNFNDSIPTHRLNGEYRDKAPNTNKRKQKKNNRKKRKEKRKNI